METLKVPARRDDRVIIHFDYDCFYASVFEARNPSLKSLPFAVQQKQIIVTCNYEARRRGLYKLQLIRDARRVCPDVIIELGEDISQFRDASKDLYQFIKGFSWNEKIERLGFDEIWMDVTDMIQYNMDVLNRHNLASSFFQLSREDPTMGFSFDASSIAGHAYPDDYIYDDTSDPIDDLTLHLRLGSHLALYLRHQLEQIKGYTSTVGISTSKLLSKLVGNLNKPKGQTTIMPPLFAETGGTSHVTTFIDGHEIDKIPGIGFKLAQRLREFFLQRPAAFDAGLVYGGTKEKVSVADLRNHPEVNPEMLEKLLAGPGSPHGIGHKIWCLLHGVDESIVSYARPVPRQISIEDSYIRLDTMPEVLRQLTSLAQSLLNRMRIDLLGSDDDDDVNESKGEDDESQRILDKPSKAPIVAGKKWLAHPRTLRLTTRPRQPLQPDGTRIRSFKRISHSGPLPNFVFSLQDSVEMIAERLVKESLVSMFRRLHPEKAGWNLSLVNLAVTNMAETGGESRTANGRDISNMFRKQEDVLKDYRVTDVDSPPKLALLKSESPTEAPQQDPDDTGNDDWDDGESSEESNELCPFCGLFMPTFAMIAHRRFHEKENV